MHRSILLVEGLNRGLIHWHFGRGVAIIDRVRRGYWAPMAKTDEQFAYAAATAMLVLVVHSVHVHATSLVHDDSAAIAPSDPLVVAQRLQPGEFLDHAGAVARCMTLEFSAPRVAAFALAASGFVVMLLTRSPQVESL